ncbi:transmembrane protein 258-like [Sinocyclocheilus rhinocerous]|uniref:transmembrane protein 258-like n=1 Tax=Sinocyclocheilus rhinocerous TaxID=307959 RepID=UPI0007B7C837|nr:PREDICTED: transmembrane protein 258-like [Sinocyclocheilus rhinocerous]
MERWDFYFVLCCQSLLFRSLHLRGCSCSSSGRTDSAFTCHAMELEAMTRYTSPVNPAVFPHLTVVLLAIGMFFTAWFFVYEVTSTKYTRDLYKELLISLVASLFMGFGVLFLLLWVGIYV